ncbi:MAG: cation-translocating P-type ATPase [Deltaproteobacteria bacterium]|nr:cation-translocating P-type ATPase [Deltaproteobacteria bacterium]
MPIVPAAPAAVSRPGLSAQDAAQRLAEHGANELHRSEPTPRWRLFARQLMSPVIGLLIAAAIAAGVLKEWVDAVAILAIVLLNAVIGYSQESRAEDAVRALRAMTAPRATARRDGQLVKIPAAEIVVGDLLVLEAGDKVAADARLIEAHALRVDEAALTGESEAVEKSTAPVADDAPIAERTDQVFAGTSITAGVGVAEVLKTGMNTEIGRIAKLLGDAEEGLTPLQLQLNHVTSTLIKACLVVVALVAALGVYRAQPWLDVLLSSVSLAVAAVPEGLPVVVSLALAVGVQRLAARHVLVRKLMAVETLGATSVVCTDKTGTLTTGQMTARALVAPDEQALLWAAAACCDAELASRGGDTTELAILQLAAERGVTREAIEAAEPRVFERPFDTNLRRMSIFREGNRLYMKGGIESVLPLCSHGAERAQAENDALAARGLRVLAVAKGEGPDEAGLTLMGLIGLADPPRPEAVAAVAEARGAGIVTVMITGDQKVTALAIAREMGILAEGEPPDERVHARVSPEEKLNIVREWKAKGAIVAMTGDGVNDAPALKEAHVGVAMGIAGTEVTREAADIVLADDNFASIIAGVREGRAIFDNIRKTLVYLLTGNAAELLLMLIAALAGLPVPLLPIHLLWINLVTDGLPALALSLDPTQDDVLKRPPRDAAEPMLGRAQWLRVAVVGALEAALTLGVYLWALDHGPTDAARDLAFTTLVFSELMRSFAARSDTRTLPQLGAASNLRLLAVVTLTGAAQVGMHFVPGIRAVFGLHPLTLGEIGLCFLLGLIPVTILEVTKLVRGARG